MGKKSMKKILITLGILVTMILGMSITTSAEANKVTGLKEYSAGTDSCTVMWDIDTATDTYAYALYVSLDNSSYALYDVYKTNGAVISGMGAGKSYYVVVRAIYGTSDSNITGMSQPSDPLQIISCPDKIEATTMKQIGYKTNSVTLSWGAVEGASGYIIYNEDGVTEITRTTATSYTAKATAGNTYTYGVVAYKKSSSGYEAKGAGYLYTTLTIPGVPEPASIDWKPVQDKGKITVSWNRNKNDKYVSHGYEINIYTLSGKKLKTYTVNSGYTLTKSFKNKKVNNKGFKYKVRSYITISGTKYYSGWSKQKVVIPQAKIPKGNGQNLDNSKLKFKWTKVKGARKYYIYVAKTYSGTGDQSRKSYKKVAVVGKNVSSYIVTGLSKYNYTSVYVIPVVKVGKKTYKGTACEAMSYTLK